MRHAIGQIATGAALVMAALVCALPWTATDAGHQPPLAGLGAALPAILVFAFAYWRPDLVTAGATFLAGLFVDATTGSPLGFWSLLYLLCLGMARFAHNRLDAPSLVGGLITSFLAALLSIRAGWAAPRPSNAP